jgi:hypothetical protein
MVCLAEYSGVAEPPIPVIRATPIPVAGAAKSGNANQQKKADQITAK